MINWGDVAVATRFRPEDVAIHWPLIADALTAEGAGEDLVLVAAAATLKAESPARLSCKAELYNGDPQEYFKRYDGRRDLGNVHPGDGYLFRGRGYPQLTGRANYRNFGKRLGLPLEENPDLALVPETSARIFAAFMVDKGVARCARKQDWRAVRKIWNGGTNGWQPFIEVVNAFKKLTPEVFQPPADFSDVEGGSSTG